MNWYETKYSLCEFIKAHRKINQIQIISGRSWLSICVNGSIFSASRTIFAAARKHHMPSLLALIHTRYLTPITSILFMALLSTLCLLFDDVYVLLKVTLTLKDILPFGIKQTKSSFGNLFPFWRFDDHGHHYQEK